MNYQLEERKAMQNRTVNLPYLALFVVVVSTITILIFSAVTPGPVFSPGTNQSSAVYDRVMKSGVIRAGYIIYPPGSYKDPNTGKLSGVFVEALEGAASNMDLKVEWVEEVSWGSMIEGLNAGRYDLIGTQVWANSTRAKFVDFSVPLFYSGIGVFVRSNDDRFDGDLSKINSSSVRIATIDGEMSAIIAKQDYPHAQTVSHPQLSDNSQILLDVATGKADVTFVEPYIADLFLANNAGTLRNLVIQRPIRIFPNTMLVPTGDIRFKTMLDTALTELLNTGYVDELMLKYVPTKGAFYPVDYPYRTEERP